MYPCNFFIFKHNGLNLSFFYGIKCKYKSNFNMCAVRVYFLKKTYEILLKHNLKKFLSMV